VEDPVAVGGEAQGPVHESGSAPDSVDRLFRCSPQDDY
jgi:hypothetical protein